MHALTFKRRQRKRKLAAFAYFALHPDPSSMQLDELLGQRQTKSCPFALVLIVAADLAKLLEDPWLVLGRDADAGVADRDFHRAITLSGVNSDPSSLRGELHCI